MFENHLLAGEGGEVHVQGQPVIGGSLRVDRLAGQLPAVSANDQIEVALRIMPDDYVQRRLLTGGDFDLAAQHTTGLAIERMCDQDVLPARPFRPQPWVHFGTAVRDFPPGRELFDGFRHIDGEVALRAWAISAGVNRLLAIGPGAQLSSSLLDLGSRRGMTKTSSSSASFSTLPP